MFNAKLCPYRHLQCHLFFSILLHTAALLKRFSKHFVQLSASYGECTISLWNTPPVFSRPVSFLIICRRRHGDISAFPSATLEVIVHGQFPTAMFIHTFTCSFSLFLNQNTFPKQYVPFVLFLEFNWIYSQQGSDFFFFYYSKEKLRPM